MNDKRNGPKKLEKQQALMMPLNILGGGGGQGFEFWTNNKRISFTLWYTKQFSPNQTGRLLLGGGGDNCGNGLSFDEQQKIKELVKPFTIKFNYILLLFL